MNFRSIVAKVSTAAFALMLPWSSATAADYLGKVTSVADGDTFTMESETGKVRIRICGIDAPERGQPG
jgi:endonuclease YncB( thermonuclease family)